MGHIVYVRNPGTHAELVVAPTGGQEKPHVTELSHDELEYLIETAVSVWAERRRAFNRGAT